MMMTHRKQTLRDVPILAGFLATLLEDARLSAIESECEAGNLVAYVPGAGDTVYSCPDETFEMAAEICRAFLDVPGVAEMIEYLDAGPDLYLTCAGHGAGFWDGDWEPHGDALTEAALAACGRIETYVGDDGHVYFEGGRK
jgi:hypothetical protein